MPIDHIPCRAEAQPDPLLRHANALTSEINDEDLLCHGRQTKNMTEQKWRLHPGKVKGGKGNSNRGMRTLLAAVPRRAQISTSLLSTKRPKHLFPPSRRNLSAIDALRALRDLGRPFARTPASTDERDPHLACLKIVGAVSDVVKD
jgi:hypothetical protein